MYRFRATTLVVLVGSFLVAIVLSQIGDVGGTPSAFAAPSTSAAISFPVGPGFSDIVPHQIVRTADDRVRIFAASLAYSSTIVTYWTPNPGLPGSQADFSGTAQVTDTAYIISVDAVYDASQTVHVLASTHAGLLKDYPFHTTTNTFRPAKVLASGVPTVAGDYLGSSAVSGIVDSTVLLHVAH